MAGMAMWTHGMEAQLGKPTTLGAASGAIAGLATITPAAGFVGPNSAVVIGMLGGMICYTAVLAKKRFGYDDSLDVVGIHGVGGLLGTICLGVFASTAVNPAGADGLLRGNFSLLLSQLQGIFAVGAYTFVISYALLKLINAVSPLRLSAKDEEDGLDTAEHCEAAYQN
jgi:Amt family ammonium transporter